MNKELSTEKIMTIKEIYESLNIPKRTVVDTVKRLFPDLMQHGKTTYLTEKQVSLVSKELKKAHNLKSADSRTVAITDIELIERSKDLLIDLTMRLDQANKEVAVLKPKALLADEAIRDKSKQYSITDAGKHLGISQKEIFNILRENNLLTSKDIPSQKSLDMNILELRTNIVNGKNRPQSVMTMENIFNFKERYCIDQIEECRR